MGAKWRRIQTADRRTRTGNYFLTSAITDMISKLLLNRWLQVPLCNVSSSVKIVLHLMNPSQYEIYRVIADKLISYWYTMADLGYSRLVIFILNRKHIFTIVLIMLQRNAGSVPYYPLDQPQPHSLFNTHDMDACYGASGSVSFHPPVQATGSNFFSNQFQHYPQRPAAMWQQSSAPQTQNYNTKYSKHELYFLVLCYWWLRFD